MICSIRVSGAPTRRPASSSSASVLVLANVRPTLPPRLPSAKSTAGRDRKLTHGYYWCNGVWCVEVRASGVGLPGVCASVIALGTVVHR